VITVISLKANPSVEGGKRIRPFAGKFTRNYLSPYSRTSESTACTVAQQGLRPDQGGFSADACSSGSAFLDTVHGHTRHEAALSLCMTAWLHARFWLSFSRLTLCFFTVPCRSQLQPRPFIRSQPRAALPVRYDPPSIGQLSLDVSRTASFARWLAGIEVGMLTTFRGTIGPNSLASGRVFRKLRADVLHISFPLCHFFLAGILFIQESKALPIQLGVLR